MDERERKLALKVKNNTFTLVWMLLIKRRQKNLDQVDQMSANLQPLTVCAQEPAATTPSCGLNKSSALCWELDLFTLGEYTFIEFVHKRQDYSIRVYWNLCSVYSNVIQIGKIALFQRRKAYLIALDLQNAITFGKVKHGEWGGSRRGGSLPSTT